MKKSYVIAFILASAAGTALHFLFDALPNPLTALVSPISESVWEHLKLVFWPILLSAIFLSLKSPAPYRLWSGFLTALLAGPLFLTGAYYLLKCGLGLESLSIDLALYYITMAVSFLLAYAIDTGGRWERAVSWLVFPVILYGASLILFTFSAPEAPIFLPPMMN